MILYFADLLCTYCNSVVFDVTLYQASVNCVSDTGCAPYQDSPLTQLTSLLDLQMRPYFHTGNILDFIQTGHEDEGTVGSCTCFVLSFNDTQHLFILSL